MATMAGMAAVPLQPNLVVRTHFAAPPAPAGLAMHPMAPAMPSMAPAMPAMPPTPVQQAQLHGMARTETFVVEAGQQRANLATMMRNDQHLVEVYRKPVPLCFSGATYQKTHPIKAQKGRKDADVTLVSPVVMGVADGVSQIEDYGIDASRLPKELMQRCESLGESQLGPNSRVACPYHGPTQLVRDAYVGTAPTLGSTTLCLALMDNTTKMHGSIHPMMAIISIGDCELLVLRRDYKSSLYSLVFQTEMQRIDGHLQTPLQLARVDERIDRNFHDGITIEVIEKGAAVHLLSVYEGDLVVMGSDGVFDNLFVSEVCDLANSIIRPGLPTPVEESKLELLARKVVEECHNRTRPDMHGQYKDAPIGRGGKVDDTSCAVAEVVEMRAGPDGITWGPSPESTRDVDEDDDEGIGNLLYCGAVCSATDRNEVDFSSNACGISGPGFSRKRRTQPQQSRIRQEQSEATSGSEEEDTRGCAVA